MKILFLTQYFPPEVGAPQNRLFELALRVQKEGNEISVLTAMPNYPRMEKARGYKGKLYCREEMDSLIIHRAYIFVKKSSSLILRLLNYFSFVISSILVGIFKIKKQDYIFCESPPLFLGISALVLCRFKKAKLIFNVSDLWPESAEKLGLVKNKFLLRSATRLEENLYKKAWMVTCQTNGILNNIAKRFPEKKIFWLKNGVDFNRFDKGYLTNAWRKLNSFSEGEFLIYYGGIFGYAQGLEVILFAADKLRNNPSIKFILMGDGPERNKLLNLKKDLKLSNILFYDPMPKGMMPEIINSIDVGVIPLKNIELFRGAIPSKIFEIQALKKPILIGIEGEAYELFIKQGKGGLSFKPENSEDLAVKILTLYESPSLIRQLGEDGYKYVKENFNRDDIAAEFVSLLDK